MKLSSIPLISMHGVGEALPLLVGNISSGRGPGGCKLLIQTPPSMTLGNWIGLAPFVTSHKYKCVINTTNSVEEEKTLEQAATTVFPNKTYLRFIFSGNTKKTSTTNKCRPYHCIDGVRFFISAIPNNQYFITSR